MSSLWSLTLRQLAHRMVRTALTLLSVSAAVAAVVAVVQAVAAARLQQRQLYTVLTGRADLEILERKGERFDQKTLELVRQTPGIAVASPYLGQLSTLFVSPHKVRLQLLGVDPGTDRQIRQYAILEGRDLEPAPASEPGGKVEVLIDRDIARKLGIRIGQTVRLLTRRAGVASPLSVVGVFAPEGIVTAAQGVSVVMRLGDLQRLFGNEGQLGAVRCVLDGSRPRQAVMADLAEKLPQSLTVEDPASRIRLPRDTQTTLEYFLILTGGVVVLAAGFVLLNTFLISIEEQRGSFALLRLVGLTTGQARRLVLLGTIPVALLGTALGLLLGWVGGMHLTGLGGDFSLLGPTPQVKSAGGTALGWGLLAGAIVGPVLTLLAALRPARLAGTISPLEALRQAQGSPPLSSRLLPVVTGLVLLGAALAVLASSVAGVLSANFFLPAALLALVAGLLLVPLWFEPVTAVASWLLRPLLGYETTLAREQVTRRAGRNALAAGILFLATAAGVAVNNTSLNLIDDIKSWYHKGYPVQFFLRSPAQNLNRSDPAVITQELSDQAVRLPGVTRLERVEVVGIDANGVNTFLIAREFGAYQEPPLSLTAGTMEEVRRGLRDGEVLLGNPVARMLGLKPGDEVEVTCDGDSKRFRVAGVCTEYLFSGQVVVMERETARQAFGLDRIDGLMIESAPRALDSVHRELRPLAEEHGLVLSSFTELADGIHSTTGSVRDAVGLLLAVSFLLCGFGIANTLTMNVLEQGREFGLLRLVGLKRAGLRRLVLLQTALLSACGIVPGLLAGLGLAWLINQDSGQLFGNPIPFRLHLTGTAACGLAALVLALAAAWPPASRAARLNPLEAVRRG